MNGDEGEAFLFLVDDASRGALDDKRSYRLAPPSAFHSILWLSSPPPPPRVVFISAPHDPHSVGLAASPHLISWENKLSGSVGRNVSLETYEFMGLLP